jgi:hypothetical protein
MPLPITENNGTINIVKLYNGQGFGLENDAALESKKRYAIRVSDEIDYCISFWIKQTTLEPSLELSLTGFNCEFDLKRLSKNILDGIQEPNFIKPNEKIVSTTDRYYFCRFILYRHDQPVNSTQPLNSMAAGRNLIMEKGTVNVFVNLKSVAPIITDNDGNVIFENHIKIWNFKVRPLRTPFSTGFLGTNNLLEIWRKNNKKHVSNEEIDNLAKDYLLPYNSIPAVINL